ncbi:oxidoreductase [Zalerion maritima]|uniref:Oxidoreductase n=1 Tax=Zalerion maritima TaxID=339359 RepID=A0AAD5RK18_9PEZI|nr:oxidoreductase [Zalerion maritima]
MDFDPDTDIPDLSGNVIFITGGTAGIGKATLLYLAEHSPAHIYFTGRNKTAAAEIISTAKEIDSELPVTFVRMDLGSTSSVQAAVDGFLQKERRLDILILNAGVCGIAPNLTEDGYEIQFGINHMGHFALAEQLLPLLLATAQDKKEKEGEDQGVRVVTLTAKGHSVQPKYGIDFASLKSTMPNTHTWTRYGQSKLANLLFAKELARRYGGKGITSVAVHPGITGTNLVKQMGWVNRMLMHTYGGDAQTPEDGAMNVLWAATSDDVENGEVYEPVGEKGPVPKDGMNEELARKLWDWSEKEVRGARAAAA